MTGLKEGVGSIFFPREVLLVSFLDLHVLNIILFTREGEEERVKH